MTTYTAAIGTASDVVTGDFCDVLVVEDVITGYRIDDDGNEIWQTGMSDRVVLSAVELPVRTSWDDALELAAKAADVALGLHGWTRTGEWDVADNAMYAPVERA